MQPTDYITACIDGSRTTSAVCDAAIWAGMQLGTPIRMLHVLDRDTEASHPDLSGNIGLGSREHLLEKLIEIDAKRGRIAMEHGKAMLETARHHAEQAGIEKGILTLQRHGSLAETLADLQPDTRLVVMGRQGEAHADDLCAIGSSLETVIRTIHRPILVIPGDFCKPERFMIAFDGSETAEKALRMVAESPLLHGIPCHVIMAGKTSKPLGEKLQKACIALERQGFEVSGDIIEQEPVEGLESYRREQGIGLMVMGAFGHSRIREFLVGSTTRKMVSRSDIPLLILR